jgi:1-acyl-sn-glycerol-3-phosphate acyltransferase
VKADFGSLSGILGRWMHRLYEYAALWFGLGLLGTMSLTWSLLAAPLYYLLPPRWAHPVGRWSATVVFRFYLGALALVGACRFDIRALDALHAEGPLVVAPNHPCLLDALMVISRLPNLACVMKADIVDNPFLGAGARLAGYIRNDTQLSMIRQAVAELKGGSQLLLFPEGTRTAQWPIGTCTGAAALIAGQAKVPVQTVFIETDSAYLGKGWPLFRRPSMPITYRIRLGRRFDPPEQARLLTEELERYFVAELGNTPCFLPLAAESGAPQHT